MTTSELTISEQSLTFAKTVPGKPVFLVLRIATDERDVQVVASTDLPDVFQLASDDRPIFGSMLTLLSDPSGTYIHIRYQPDRSGVHEGTLHLQSAVGTRTVTLSGRCTRIAGVHTNSNKVLTRTVASQETSPTTARNGMWVAAAAILVGLLYTGITYRCQLMPSLCQQEAATGTQVVTTSATPVIERPVATPVPENVAPSKPAVARRVTKSVKQASPERKRTGSEEQSPTAVKPSVAVTGKALQDSRSATVKTNRVTKPQVEPARPVKSVAENEESDLERELNGRTNNN